MPKIRFYDDAELVGLTPEQLAHLRLVSRVLETDEDADAEQLERLTDSQLLHLLGESEPVRVVKPEPANPSPPKVRESKKPAKPQVRTPRTIGEAFALIDAQLMRRTVARVEVVRRDGVRFTRDVEKLTPCGDRVRFNGRTYRAGVVAHYLRTGEMVHRAPRVAKPPRYKAQIRDGARVLHLGYFATAEERDAAVFAYRLGVYPIGSKSA